MRRLVVLLGLGLVGCDTVDTGPVVAGLYRAQSTSGDTETTIDLQIPLTRSGEFRLGSRSVAQTRVGDSTTTVAVTGSGTVRNQSVSVDATPSGPVGGDIRPGPTAYRGTTSLDGQELSLSDGRRTRRFVRTPWFVIDISRPDSARSRRLARP